jgi:hypothetical protein
VTGATFVSNTIATFGSTAVTLLVTTPGNGASLAPIDFHGLSIDPDATAPHLFRFLPVRADAGTHERTIRCGRTGRCDTGAADANYQGRAAARGAGHAQVESFSRLGLAARP